MNSTEIFYNNGQLNWDAINTLSNIVLVTALVLITVLYAYEIRKQTRLMIKDRERNKVSEEVREVLTPAIEHIESEIDMIQNKKYFWQRYCVAGARLRVLLYNKRYGDVGYLFGEKSGGASQDILNKFPNLNSMFSSHDFLIDELNCFCEKIGKEIEKEIKTPNFEERLDEMIKANEQIGEKLIQLKELDRKLLKKLSKIREKYRKEYNFIDNEIEPFRGI